LVFPLMTPFLSAKKMAKIVIKDVYKSVISINKLVKLNNVYSV